MKKNKTQKNPADQIYLVTGWNEVDWEEYEDFETEEDATKKAIENLKNPDCGGSVLYRGVYPAEQVLIKEFNR